MPEYIKRILSAMLMFVLYFAASYAQDFSTEEFPIKAPDKGEPDRVSLKTNVVPWLATIPNIGAEYAFKKNWSAAIDLWYCPWKLSERFSVKTAAILPEARYWLKNNREGSFFNIHITVAWYNVRFGNFRYQDDGRLLLGGGIGYGYKLNINDKFGLEFNIGAGVATTRYDRYFNVPNGALRDTRSTVYFGIDRLGVTFTYNLAEL